jgi:mannose-1-phosphate guanylyltransferase
MVAAGAFVSDAKKNSAIKTIPTCTVLLAGGRGTRFWPRSRMRTPKQLLNIVGNKTMLRETVERLAPIIPLKKFWVVTNAEQSAAVRRVNFAASRQTKYWRSLLVVIPRRRSD